ncbi:MAG: hypothetical protein ACQETK_12950 [Pseudomonadota bacterium]
MDEVILWRRRENLAVAVMLIAMPLLTLGLVAWMVPGEGADGLGTLLQVMWEEDPVNLVGLLVLGVVAIASMPFLRRYEQRARLRVGANGIRFESGLGGWIGQLLERGWPLYWDGVDEAVLHAGPQGRNWMLSLKGRDGRMRQLRLEAWRTPGDADSVLRPRWQRVRQEELQRLLSSHPVLRWVQAAGVPVSLSERAPRVGLGTAGSVDLTIVPQGRFAIGALAALGGYGLVDGFVLQTWGYAASVPWHWLAAGGVVAALLTGAVLARSRLPLAERAGLVLLIAGAGVLAAYPGSLRINALTDVAGPVTVEYHLEQGGRLEASGADRPTLVAPIDAPFWAAQSPGSRWELELSHGALGFWQYRREPLLEHIRNHYQSRDNVPGD